MYRFSIFILLILFLAPILRSQETINNASIGGRITDISGAVIPNAVVSARSAATGLTFKTETDAVGRYRFPYLQIGKYEVTIYATGFSESARMVNLTVGAVFDLSVTLTLQTARASIRVNEEPPVLETDRSQIAATISQSEVSNLPYNGRSFLDLALLVPGVSPTNTAANQLFAETSAVGGQGISVCSQRNFSNSYIVDGLSANDDAA